MLAGADWYWMLRPPAPWIRKKKCFVFWLSGPHGTSNFDHQTLIRSDLNYTTVDNWPKLHEDIGQTFTRHKQSLINLRTPDQSSQIEIHPIHPIMLRKDILHICQTVSLPKWNLHEKGTSKFCVLKLSTYRISSYSCRGNVLF